MSERAPLGVVLKEDTEDREFNEASTPLSDQALLPAVLEDDDAQRSGGSHANVPQATCSWRRRNVCELLPCPWPIKPESQRTLDTNPADMEE